MRKLPTQSFATFEEATVDACARAHCRRFSRADGTSIDSAKSESSRRALLLKTKKKQIVFADFDSLGWDLGNPDGMVKPNLNPFGPSGVRHPFHPLKGPMTTQTLRGLVNQGPMHWRGDRTGATFVNDPLALDAELAFEAFNVAFGSLLGRRPRTQRRPPL